VDWTGLGPMTVVYKILTAYVFSAKQTKTSLHWWCLLHCCVPITSDRHV